MAYTNIDNPELYFQTKTYTGTGSSNSITLDGSENMQPDWVWIKSRSDAQSNNIFDSVRGAGELIFTDAGNAESTATNRLTAFNSDGFTVISDNAVNGSSKTYVAWCWKAGGSASSNSNGSITSSLSANTTAGFSIVSWSGSGANATICHWL